MKVSLKAKLSLNIAFVVLLTVAFISILSNIFINRQFVNYITGQQQLKTQEIVANLCGYYNNMSETWDMDSVHTLGMYSLYDGFIIKVYENDGTVLWDAEHHDMSLCANVMKEITDRMEVKYPKLKGEFQSKQYDLIQNKVKIGTVVITYYGPYFLSESDFQFLHVLNFILIGTGIAALFLSVIIGLLMAKRITKPLSDTVAIAKKIADGNYEVKNKDITGTKELDELTFSINHLAETLNKQESLRKQLTQDVSHELRTPLATVGMHLEAMIEGVWEPTKDRLNSCYEEIERLTKLVKDLEKLSRTEGDNLNLHKTKVDLCELAEKAYDSFKIEMAKKNQKFELIGFQTFVTADRDRIYQVVYNLLSNAVKYTPEDGHITIKIEDTEENATLSVQDDGLGISQEELPLIFERFYRADKSRNRKTGGAGIGLAIVKSIMTAHGGTVVATSEPGKGSCFTMELPK